MQKQMNKQKLQLKLRSGLSIGAAAAEDDKEFLRNCFVDSGYLDTLLDVQNSRSIIVARTGAGKSALIDHIDNHAENVVAIEPDQLAFTYIANSNILTFFENLGVNLDLFYQLLWKHVFCIELIKMRYGVRDEADNKNVFSTLRGLISRDKKKERALKYLEEWGDRFWLDTDVRIKEITENIETKLKASADGLKLGIPLSVEVLGELGVEVKKELLHRSQSVINDIQIKELHEIINFLSDDVFFDEEKKYYIVIDDLDRNWAFGQVRYKLIRALIETIKRLRRIRQAKIIVAIRSDLLTKVIEETIDSGFQQEKYEDSYFRLQWTEKDLKELLDLRVNYLYRSAYTKNDVHFNDLFPFKYHALPTSDYILERTQLRPRDAILFVNECLMGAPGATEITQQVIHEAEVRYSRGRLVSALQEWSGMYPNLEEYIGILQRKRARFTIKDVAVNDLSEMCLRLATLDDPGDKICAQAIGIVEKGSALNHFHFLELFSELASILHRTGIVGIKQNSQDSVIWSHRIGIAPTHIQLGLDSRIYVHPMYWIALSVTPLAPNDFHV